MLAEFEKRAEAEGRTIVRVDKSGFYLLPAKVRTYAPRGQTPILRLPLSRDHLSAISALTPHGRVFLHVQDGAFSSEDVVAFLRQLLSHIPTKLLVIWDGAPIHRSQVIQDFLASGAARRIQFERLPGYSPELNPVDGLWGYLKHRELDNVCSHNFPQLRAEIKGAFRRFHRKRHLIRSFIRHAGYQVQISMPASVNEHRLQNLDPEIFRCVGIEPPEQKIVVVKSAVHFRAAYEPIASLVVQADGPGIHSMDLARFPYRHVPRPAYGLDFRQAERSDLLAMPESTGRLLVSIAHDRRQNC